MRICVIGQNRAAYSETFIQAHIGQLPANVRYVWGNPFPMYTAEEAPLLRSVWLLERFKRAFRRIVIGASEAHIRREGIRVFLRRDRPDLVLAEYGQTGVAVMDICKEAGIPLIVHFHGYDAYDHRELEQAGLQYPELFENASATIAVSRDMERQLLALGAHRGKLHYNPYGVDTSLFHNANPAHVPPVFIAVGRFVDKKAPYLTLLSFAEVKKKIPQAQLKMIGDGPLLEVCRQLAHSLNIREVEFLGSKPHAEVAAAMQQARAFVQHSIQPSYGDSEGTPLAVLEAGAAGLPAVATRHGGIQDVIIHGKTGLLVDEGDVNGMADFMIQLADKPFWAAKLGKAARDRICSHFSMENSISGLWKIMSAVVQKARDIQ
ncbi:MAG: glycosyltransferase [Thermodesulfobacteriota bacterium]|nr:glycosyltransferase [Thermodesulfobacteriota bacterium]